MSGDALAGQIRLTCIVPGRLLNLCDGQPSTKRRGPGVREETRISEWEAHQAGRWTWLNCQWLSWLISVYPKCGEQSLGYCGDIIVEEKRVTRNKAVLFYAMRDCHMSRQIEREFQFKNNLRQQKSHKVTLQTTRDSTSLGHLTRSWRHCYHESVKKIGFLHCFRWSYTLPMNDFEALRS